ncbi:hypothetical protein JOM56_008032 [Amanita muscaria]
MGRPRLYTTLDDKKAANRAKSKRHYDQNKATIQERRQAKSKEGIKNSRVFSLSEAPPAPPKATTAAATASQVSNSLARRHLDRWFGRALRVKTEYSTLTNDAPKNFTNSLVQNLMSDKNDGVFRDALNVVSNLLQRVLRAEKEIYELHGICLQYHHVKDISSRLRELNVWLEDILCVSLLDLSELLSAFVNNQLAYQEK